jgi:hypothetical protein
MKMHYFMALALAAQVVVAEPGNKIFKSQDGFSLALPEQWVEMPKEVLTQYSELLSAAAPKAHKQSYDYGYQLAAATNWFAYPYILVQVKKSGRIPEGQLKKYRKIEEGIAKGIDEIEGTMSGLLSNAQQGETLYDSGHQVLWMNMSMDVEAVGRILAITAVKLTETGVIQVMGYATEESAQEYLPVVESAATGMSLAPDMIYISRLTDNAPTIGGINMGKVMLAAVRGGIIGGAIGLVMWINNKRKKKSPDKTSEGAVQ